MLFQEGAITNCSLNLMPRRSLRETLPDISDARLQIQAFIGALDHAPPHSARISLPQIQHLRKVVIEPRLSEAIISGRKILVAFDSRMINFRLNQWNIRLLQRSISGAEVDDGPIPPAQPIGVRDRTNQVDRDVECGGLSASTQPKKRPP